MAIGNCLSSSSNLTNNGSVTVYKWSGGAWSQLGNSIAGTSAGEYLGWSLSLGPNHTIGIGANKPDLFSTEGNLVRAFELNGTTLQQKGGDLTYASTSKYGWDVSMGSENVITIGDRHYGDSFSPPQYLKGFVTVREWNGTEWATIVAFEGDSELSAAGHSVDMLNENTFAFSSSVHVSWASIFSPTYKVDIYSFCQSVASTDVIESCSEYTWIDGNTYTSDNNTAQTILSTQGGCDSIITLDLTINQVDTAINNEGWRLESSAADATFQWINCSTNEILTGATSNYLIPAENGNYAAIITQNGCTDTTACNEIMNVGISAENSIQTQVYPNPTTDILNIVANGAFNFEIRSIDGKIVLKNSAINHSTCNLSKLKSGIYTVWIYTENQLKSQHSLIIL